MSCNFDGPSFSCPAFSVNPNLSHYKMVNVFLNAVTFGRNKVDILIFQKLDNVATPLKYGWNGDSILFCVSRMQSNNITTAAPMRCTDVCPPRLLALLCITI